METSVVRLAGMLEIPLFIIIAIIIDTLEIPSLIMEKTKWHFLPSKALILTLLTLLLKMPIISP